MDLPFEKETKNILDDIENYKTPNCLDITILWHYIENKISTSERKQTEEHLNSCIYCINQLVELREFIYSQKQVGISESLKNFLYKNMELAKVNIRNMKNILLPQTFSLRGAIVAALLLVIVVYFYTLQDKELPYIEFNDKYNKKIISKKEMEKESKPDKEEPKVSTVKKDIVKKEIGRDILFGKNEFLSIIANEESLNNINKKLSKPTISLKSPYSVEEEKEIISALFDLGISIGRIDRSYKEESLISKIQAEKEGKKIEIALKKYIIENLEEVKNILAKMESDEKILRLIDNIKNKIEKEDINTKRYNIEVVKLFEKLISKEIYDHIEYTYGEDKAEYYNFGYWILKLMNLCENRIIYENTNDKVGITKEIQKEILKELTKEIKSVGKKVIEHKLEKELFPKSSNSLDDLREILKNIKEVIDVPTAQKIYENCINISYEIIG